MKKKSFPMRKTLLMVMYFIFVVFAIILIRNPAFTGLFTADNLMSYNQTLDLRVEEDSTELFVLEEVPLEFNLMAIKLTGSYDGEGAARVYLDDGTGSRLLIFDSDDLGVAEGSFLTGKAIAGEEGGDSGDSGDSGGEAATESSDSGDSGESSSESSESGETSEESSEEAQSEEAPAEESTEETSEETE